MATGFLQFSALFTILVTCKGNDYRLVVAVHYDRGLMYIRFVGTHQQYGRIDVEAI